jgi:acetyl-CoA carboxylase biotin carboxyl carrier protein
MKIKEIRELIDFISESGLNEVNIETEEFKIKVKRSADIQTQVVEKTSSVSLPGPDSMNTLPVKVEKTAEDDAATSTGSGNYVEVKSPMIGTFYRSTTPEADPFVSVGNSISKGQTVCIVEAMKLFNEIESEISGTIIKVLVENATPVEYDQPLFLVDPS